MGKPVILELDGTTDHLYLLLDYRSILGTTHNEQLERGLNAWLAQRRAPDNPSLTTKGP